MKKLLLLLSSLFFIVGTNASIEQSETSVQVQDPSGGEIPKRPPINTDGPGGGRLL